jgi:hypothetical protein
VYENGWRGFAECGQKLKKLRGKGERFCQADGQTRRLRGGKSKVVPGQYSPCDVYENERRGFAECRQKLKKLRGKDERFCQADGQTQRLKQKGRKSQSSTKPV